MGDRLSVMEDFLAMSLFNIFNPKPTVPSEGYNKNLNRSSPSKPTARDQSPKGKKASDFFTFNGIGEVLSPITSEQLGRIHFGGTDWPAQLSHSHVENQSACVLEGMKVKVVGRQGITLLVATV